MKILYHKRQDRQKKIVLFNFTIYYKFGIKMDYIDFASRMNIFLSKKGTSI